MKKIAKNTWAASVNAQTYVLNIGSSSHWDFDEKRNTWEKEEVEVRGKKIIPYGENNDLPQVIRNILDSNNLAPGIIHREIGLLFGDGPALFRREFIDGQMYRRYDDDKDIWAWLNSWNFRRWLSMAMVEYKYLNAFFNRWYLSKGLRVPGLKSYPIAKLEVVPAVSARLGKPTSQDDLEYVTQVFTGDFENDCEKGITTNPVFLREDPLKYPTSMSYHGSYSFARKYYSMPIYYGALKWIMVSSDIPEILKYLTDNAIAMAYHIHSPQEYWESKREKLKEQYSSVEYAEADIDKKLDELKEQTFKKLSEVLAGKKNAGKFIDTVDFYDDDRNLCQWKIEPIEQESKDFIDAQLKIAEKADSATTSGMTLDPTLADIIVNGQLNSGSNKLYALMLYYASDCAIPEEVIFEPVNQAIAINFPKSDLKLGFYHRAVLKQQDITPDARVSHSQEQ